MIKNIIDGYIVSFQREDANDGEYNAMLNVMVTRPTPPSGYDYRLKADDLTWELYEIESEVEDEHFGQPY